MGLVFFENYCLFILNINHLNEDLINLFFNNLNILVLEDNSCCVSYFSFNVFNLTYFEKNFFLNYKNNFINLFVMVY